MLSYNREKLHVGRDYNYLLLSTVRVASRKMFQSSLSLCVCHHLVRSPASLVCCCRHDIKVVLMFCNSCRFSHSWCNLVQVLQCLCKMWLKTRLAGTEIIWYSFQLHVGTGARKIMATSTPVSTPTLMHHPDPIGVTKRDSLWKFFQYCKQ